MPYKIGYDSRCKGKWAVVKKDDNKLLGCHDTKESAKKQIAAIHARKGK